MKRFLVYAIGVLMIFSSCNGILDVEPDGRTSLDKIFADPELAAAYFSNCYNNIPHKSRRYFWFSNYPIAISDEAWSCDDVNGQGPVLAYKGQASASLNPLDHVYHDQFDGDYWKRYWEQIRTINVFLQRIPTAIINNESDRNRWTGEAYTLRAYFYLQLIKWYGNVPVVTTPYPMDYDYSQIKKNTFMDCFKFIVADCDEALKSNMPWRITSSSEKWRMTKAIAMAIRSQAALYAASPLYADGTDLWEWAYQINKDCFDQLKSNGYELYTKKQTENYASAYAEYFVQNGSFSTAPVDKETIWQSQIGEEGMWWVWGTPVHGNYNAGCVPSQQLVDAYDMLNTGKPVLKLDKPYNDETMLEPNYYENSGYNPKKPYDGRDPRFYATIIYNNCKLQIGDNIKTIQTYIGGNCELQANSDKYTRTGYYARKGMYYRSSSQYGGEDGKWKYYRLGEVYLNLAEAAIEANHIDEGIVLINEIRHRAGFDPKVDVVASNKAEARLLLRHERQVELAYEEHRYWDVRRWTISEENLYNEKYCVGMEIAKKGLSYDYKRFIVGSDGTTPSKMTYESKWHFFPIPSEEAARMESLTGDKWQNAGW